MGGRVPPRPGAGTRRRTAGTPGRPGRRKRLGQHFLAPAWARKVVAAIEPRAGDVFLEIGAGSGALTLPLAESNVPVLAVEIDRDLARRLAERAPGHVTVVPADVLDLEVVAFMRGLAPQRAPEPSATERSETRHRVVGNLPYNVATPILLRLIDLHRRHRFFSDATIMVQREVADRLTARPGTRDYGALTLAATVHTRVSRLLSLPPGAFAPPPKVRSTLIRVEFLDPTVKLADESLFHSLVRAIFTQRRKVLANALKAFDPMGPVALNLAGIDPRRRPETLQVQEIARLVEVFASIRRGPML